MNKFKYLILFLLLMRLPLFSQSAVIRSIYPVIQLRNSKDTVKSIAYPVVTYSVAGYSNRINSIIKASLFNRENYDTSHSIRRLLQEFYSKGKVKKMYYSINLNKNGFLSLTIYFKPSGSDSISPIYLNFDLTNGNFITIKDLIKSKNDSVSLGQGIIPEITDSIRLFEVKIDVKNPKYSEIIEKLNGNLGTFRHHYQEDFILTNREIIIYFDCFLPSGMLSCYHRYAVPFSYKILRNMFKPDLIHRLLTI
jgi:hypothetical protein